MDRVISDNSEHKKGRLEGFLSSLQEVRWLIELSEHIARLRPLGCGAVFLVLLQNENGTGVSVRQRYDDALKFLDGLEEKTEDMEKLEKILRGESEQVIDTPAGP